MKYKVIGIIIIIIIIMSAQVNRLTYNLHNDDLLPGSALRSVASSYLLT